MTFTMTKDEEFIRVVASGSDTYANRDGLKALGFTWTKQAWRAMKYFGEEGEAEEAANWIERVLHSFPQAEWQGPEWALELIKQEREAALAR